MPDKIICTCGNTVLRETQCTLSGAGEHVLTVIYHCDHCKATGCGISTNDQEAEDRALSAFKSSERVYVGTPVVPKEEHIISKTPYRF